jgi:hypothetical protein
MVEELCWSDWYSSKLGAPLFILGCDGECLREYGAGASKK